MATSSLADRLANADAVLSLGMSPGVIGTIGRALYARYVAVMTGYVPSNHFLETSCSPREQRSRQYQRFHSKGN